MLQCKSTTSSMEMDKITVPEKVKQGKTLRDQLKEQVMLTRLSGSAELVSAECLNKGLVFHGAQDNAQYVFKLN